jgi:hypothetical protein
MTDETQNAPEEKKLDPRWIRARKRPLSDVALAAMAYFVDNGLYLVTCQMIRSSQSIYSAFNPATLKTENSFDLPKQVKFDGTTYDALWQRGYIRQLNKESFEKRLAVIAEEKGVEVPPYLDGRSFFGWKDYIHGITKDGREYLEANRDRLNAYFERKRLSEEQPTYVVMKNREGYWGNRIIKGVGIILRVVRETPSRIYVKPITDDEVKQLGLKHYDPRVNGSSGDTWVDRADVMMVGVSLETYAKLLDVTRDYMDSRSRTQKRMEDEIAAIKSKYQSAELQNEAMVDDMFREILGSGDVAPEKPKM